MSRLALVQALEACEAGDYRFVADMLLVVLEELDEGPIVYRATCADCGQRFEWPGLLAAHHCLRAVA